MMCVTDIRHCPVVEIKITDQLEVYPNWSSVEFADKFLVFTKADVDRAPLISTYVGTYPCLYPDQTSGDKDLLSQYEKSALQLECQEQDERFIKLEGVMTNELNVQKFSGVYDELSKVEGYDIPDVAKA